MDKVKGFKVFRPDWTCSPSGNIKQYTCPGKFEENVTPIRCGKGMHFCRKLADCFGYYTFDPNNKVAEIIAYGNIVEEGDKCCTDKLEIVRELTWHEVLELVNLGKDCTGLRNTGDRNTGDCNTGNRNTGDRNTGDRNTGDRNTGNRNTGDRNTGDRNTGLRNTGDCNTGDCNTGNRNTGDRNTGDCNTGNRNTGDWNTGDCNLTNRNTGCFNTENHNILFFDKESNISYSDWYWSKAYDIMNMVDFRPTEWICESEMSNEEKQQHPEYKMLKGYLKKRSNGDCYEEWWRSLDTDQRCEVQNIPNFDLEKFYKITGIQV